LDYDFLINLKNPHPLGVVMFLQGYTRKAYVVEKNLRCKAKIGVRANSFGGG
jgi:hypothetical protein